VVTATGKLVRRAQVATTIPDLVAAVTATAGPRHLTFEEGPLAGWLARNLAPHVDDLVVCDPRRNALIAKESDKADPLDAVKLAQLFRGGYLKAVHQAGSEERAVLKQHVAFYHDRVRDRVRQGHQVVALLRRHGVIAGITAVADPAQRTDWLRRLPSNKVLRQDLELLLTMYDLYLAQEAQVRATLVRLARRAAPVRRFTAVPGIGWIRALTFYVYIDTPTRFPSKAALWRYCGLGLERRQSGRRPAQTRLCRQGNRVLKGTLIGAAQSALRGDNPFADRYHRGTQEQGLFWTTARRAVARQLAVTLWSLWKHDTRYDPARVGGPVATAR
jgi:transposase